MMKRHDDAPMMIFPHLGDVTSPPTREPAHAESTPELAPPVSVVVISDSVRVLSLADLTSQLLNNVEPTS